MHVYTCVTAPDTTQKFLIELDDGLSVESVLIPHKRTVCACLSSQVGCAMNCSFCATGKMGFARNLTADEIVGQFELLGGKEQITNVVFMGMGEPLHNYDAVVSAVNQLRKKGVSWQKITVSTVGLPDKIKQLGKDTQCKLAVSLHSSNDELRKQLVPLNYRYPIKEVLDACKEFPLSKKNPLMIEYVLLAGINDSLDCANELSVLLRQIPHIVINLIQYNPVEGAPYTRPSDTTTSAFKGILVNAGYKTIIRTTKGLEAKAACGMLATGRTVYNLS